MLARVYELLNVYVDALPAKCGDDNGGNSHLDIRSCWVGEVHLLELNSTVKLFWNYALIGTGIDGWFLHCMHA